VSTFEENTASTGIQSQGRPVCKEQLSVKGRNTNTTKRVAGWIERTEFLQEGLSLVFMSQLFLSYIRLQSMNFLFFAQQNIAGHAASLLRFQDQKLSTEHKTLVCILLSRL
jgi:hypothetical protein